MEGCTLLLSDVHADVGALEAILRVAGGPAFRRRYGEVGRTVNLGDVVERGYLPCEAVDRMRRMPNLTSIMGNHDEAFAWSTPVSGSDPRSAAAHEACRRRGGWESFFRGLPVAYVDRKERLYFVHGGPLGPAECGLESFDRVTAWLSSPTWQRISQAGTGYFDMSGYHYTPEQAFGSVRGVLGDGFALVCGHEHVEAAYRERGGMAEDVLAGLEKDAFEAEGRKVEEKRLALEDGANYLVRLGIAGPAGYYERYGWDRCYFGVYYRRDGRRHISMLSFPLGRGAVPPP